MFTLHVYDYFDHPVMSNGLLNGLSTEKKRKIDIKPWKINGWEYDSFNCCMKSLEEKEGYDFLKG